MLYKSNAYIEILTPTSHLNIIRFFVDGKQIKTRETAARIALEDDIFRAMTRQVQYMAIHCTLK